MGDQIHVLATTLLGNDSIEETSVDAIRALADRFPYFAPAQFLLAQKLKNEDSDSYARQLQKAALYFHNPLLFEFFINSEKFKVERTDEQVRIGENVEESHIILNNTDENLSEVRTGEIDANENDPGKADTEVQLEEAFEEKDELVEQDSKGAHQNGNEIEVKGEGNVEEGEDQGPVEKDNDEKNTVVAIAEEKERENQQQLEEVQQNENQEEKESGGAPSAVVQAAGVNAEPLAFEPFHTVDYFASQGIRLSQEDFGKDKFGKQLKSFTEWLKTMKRLPPQKVAAEAPQDAGVAGMAETSIHHSDVVTETMAEVWLKQGNREKAIETYNKLSLQNPPKKAYFAALIEKLK